ncbi:MAG: type II toxin-antitoxin system RelE/ParE family toxin [Ignavibacteriales bacterium]|nr:type II toxin-antitoxin system RelE/ParE family toxin [Ignavibacteriota bacterium]MCB9247644.1 type II toxin-antitoxin system RelE/ParE family toxin [Ignavibacteriales bacterium]
MAKSKFQIRLLKIAEEDFTEIISYIAADNPNAASKLADKIEKNLELLSENPKLGRIPRDEEIRNLGYRYIIIQNYIIFYTIDERTIVIHRILHSARNYKSIL